VDFVLEYPQAPIEFYMYMNFTKGITEIPMFSSYLRIYTVKGKLEECGKNI
jgi:hypothetical protein